MRLTVVPTQPASKIKNSSEAARIRAHAKMRRAQGCLPRPRPYAKLPDPGGIGPGRRRLPGLRRHRMHRHATPILRLLSATAAAGLLLAMTACAPTGAAGGGVAAADPGGRGADLGLSHLRALCRSRAAGGLRQWRHHRLGAARRRLLPQRRARALPRHRPVLRRRLQPVVRSRSRRGPSRPISGSSRCRAGPKATGASAAATSGRPTMLG